MIVHLSPKISIEILVRKIELNYDGWKSFFCYQIMFNALTNITALVTMRELTPTLPSVFKLD
jgi:hypothetical protein